MANVTLVNADNQTAITGWNSTSTGLLPSNATQLTGSSGVVVAATGTATLTSAASKTAYLTGFTVVGLGATAGIVATVTITGLIGGTLNFGYPVPTGAGASGPTMSMNFSPPLTASAVNTNIVVTVATFGAGNVGASVMAQGYMI